MYMKTYKYIGLRVLVYAHTAYSVFLSKRYCILDGYARDILMIVRSWQYAQNNCEFTAW